VVSACMHGLASAIKGAVVSPRGSDLTEGRHGRVPPEGSQHACEWREGGMSMHACTWPRVATAASRTASSSSSSFNIIELT